MSWAFTQLKYDYQTREYLMDHRCKGTSMPYKQNI